MKILALSDIYGNRDLINELCEKFHNESFDVIIVAGGILNARNSDYQVILNLLAGLGKKVLFVPGGTDQKEIDSSENLINIDNGYVVIEKNGLKVGFFGIGGVPDKSIKRKNEYPYIWNETICNIDLIRKLKTNYQKLKLEKVDSIILISHTPPYGIADYSRKITLNDFEIIEETEKQDIEDKKKTTNPIFLGSKILKEFIKNNKINIHIFGHVHKEGGKKIVQDDTIFLNVSHFSPLPYKLTGRKICVIELSNEIKTEFRSIVNNGLEFEEFLHTYL